MASRKWTIEEDEVVKEMYGKIQAKEIAELLGTGRTAEGVRIRAKTLKVNGTRAERWTKDEEALLLERYEELSPTAMHSLIPNKTIAAIQVKANLMNLKSREIRVWTKEEEQFMLDNYVSLPNRLIEEILDRSENSVQRKAEEMGLVHTKVPSQFELYVESLLKELGVIYKREVKIGKFICDFVINESKIIETYGDYWHCNPSVYTQGPKFPSQHSQIERDKRRASYLKREGYELLIIWERDALTNKSKVVSQISEFLNLQTPINPKAIYYWNIITKNQSTYLLYYHLKDKINLPIQIDYKIEKFKANLKLGNTLLVLREYEANNKSSKLLDVQNHEERVQSLKDMGYVIIEIPVQELVLNPESVVSNILSHF